jgi:hypothetical protein
MMRTKAALMMLLILGAVLFATGLPGQSRPEAVSVPEGNGRPILTDGLFSPGEWDDALTVQVRPDLQLLLKKTAGFVFLGLKYSPVCLSVVDLYISPDGKTVHHLHVSAQLSERRLAGPGSAAEPPPFVWGATSDWYANELRWDPGKAEALKKEGKNQYQATTAALYRYEGFEFQIRQSKFGSGVWLVRLETPMPDTDEGPVVFPPGTSPASTEGWLKLDLGAAPAAGREPAAMNKIGTAARSSPAA